MVGEQLLKTLAAGRLVVFLLAFVIAAQAFRGYRRNDSPPMLYLAAAFVLFGLKPFVAVVLARLSGGLVAPRLVMAVNVVVLGTAFVLVHQSLRLVEGGSA
jgi:hypothetical protein